MRVKAASLLTFLLATASLASLARTQSETVATQVEVDEGSSKIGRFPLLGS